MNSSIHNEITAGFNFQPTWISNRAPNPLSWQNAVEWKARQEALRKTQEEESAVCVDLQARVSAFNEKYQTPQCVRKGKGQSCPQPQSTWPGWYSCSDMIAIALGAPEPHWRDGYWWGQWENAPLREVRTPADVARIRVPDWPSLAIVQRMLANRERWQRECSEEPSARLIYILDVWVPGQAPVPGICYPSFVDLGIYLMGMTSFLDLLGSEPETADALMDLCFELSTSYVDFLLRQQPETFSSLVSFGGDGTCMLSPGLYDRYSAAWDQRIMKYVQDRHGLSGDAPCNLHSCGPSAHLYERWGKHPYRQNITLMQTRLVSCQVAKLRANLPDTILQLTLHPPHFDAVTATPEALRQVLWNSGREAGYGNVDFYVCAVVHHPEDLGRAEQALEVCQTVIEQMRNTL